MDQGSAEEPANAWPPSSPGTGWHNGFMGLGCGTGNGWRFEGSISGWYMEFGDEIRVGVREDSGVGRCRPCVNEECSGVWRVCVCFGSGVEVRLGGMDDRLQLGDGLRALIAE